MTNKLEIYHRIDELLHDCEDDDTITSDLVIFSETVKEMLVDIASSTEYDTLIGMTEDYGFYVKWETITGKVIAVIYEDKTFISNRKVNTTVKTDVNLALILKLMIK